MCSNSSQHMRMNKVVQEALVMKNHGIATKPKVVRATYLSRHLVKKTSLLKMYQNQLSPSLIHSHLQSITLNSCSFLQKFHDADVEGGNLDSPKAFHWSNTQLEIKKQVQMMKCVFYQKGELRKIENEIIYLGFKK